MKQSVISVALGTPLKTRLGMRIYKTSLPHRPDNYIGFTSSCPPHILQQNCAHAYLQHELALNCDHAIFETQTKELNRIYYNIYISTTHCHPK